VVPGMIDDRDVRSLMPRWNWWDWACLGVLAVVTILMMARSLDDPLRPLSGDLVNFFVPMFSFLGQELRAGRIPGWNPHQFSGAPFAGDPQSGWMSLLVMGPFSLLPLAGAVWTMNLLHLLVLSTSTYLFGRLIGLSRAGALAAAVVYEFSLSWQRTECCPQITFALTWLPVMLLAAEMALRAATPLGRIGWLLLGGLAVSQELSGWLGQGAFYQFMIAGGWLAFRALLWPPDAGRTVPRRFLDLAVGGALMFGSGALFNAAALLPRLEYNRVSNVAGGEYRGVEAGWANDFGGIEVDAILPRLFGGFTQGEWLHAGAADLVLALLCPFLAPRWRPWLFWGGAAIAMVMLAVPDRNIAHLLFGLIPGFATIHGHYMHRIVLALPLAIGLLAGASVTVLTGRGSVSRMGKAAAATALAIVAAAALTGLGTSLLSAQSLATMLAAAALALLASLGGLPLAGRTLMAAGFAVLLFWDSTGRLMSTGVDLRTNWFKGGFEQYLSRDGAAGFLLEQDPSTFRYFGFEPGSLEELSIRHGYIASAQTLHLVPLLVAGNQASALGLDDVQGYNPVHSMRYVEWVRAMNGQPQLYRFGNVYPSAIGSPLLDLLGARYAIVPPASRAEDAAITALAGEWPMAFQDDATRVLENPDAAPRAWLVNEARLVAPGASLELLSSGAVDGREVALVEDAGFAFASQSLAPRQATVTVLRPDSDTMILPMSQPSTGQGLVVIGEVFDTGWKAEVDGKPAPVAVVHHALMGVPIPAGAKEVVLRYDPVSLRIGILASVLMMAVASAIWAANGWNAVRERRNN
jgi:hypothetical protein